ncbi:MAG: undecaprenyldiphospho-muramoylpentapeptide beta-N-acetylglucosaminyltransferase [Methylococcales bacterium]|jgi:UDP-N-acetylglucosamine--N-acetylmuramyl-(pentapeptide) pyrophosphoryl-undecaprenol N-acetylglucosamine transferase|nr:MAG: undecaprenyldiphospho-muramoylpentapeptide beta-N-acetylglucosaminyltransferase [Methylococcales bacterium]
MGKRIVIMAGGTGGHVFPALAVAEFLKELGWQVSWLGTHKGLESRVVPENGIEIDWLSIAGIRGKGLAAKLAAIVMLFKACVQANKILRKRKPDVVLGMGGYVAGPGGLMARLLGIPLVIHEQNRIPGTTNRLLARISNQVLQAFPNSFSKKVNAKHTGNPLRKRFVSASKQERRQIEKEVRILIVGGSQGAQILNNIVPEAIAEFMAINDELSSIEIMHQTGEAQIAQVKNRYDALNIKAKTFAFIEDMVAAYQWADIVICRAGAMTVSEVSAMGLPAIFVPLPTAIDDHQTANARYLTDNSAALLLVQSDLNSGKLALYIIDILKNASEMRIATQRLARLDATSLVASYCSAEAEL